jgi:hypothetical protein
MIDSGKFVKGLLPAKRYPCLNTLSAHSYWFCRITAADWADFFSDIAFAS